MTLETDKQNGWYKCSSCDEPVKPVFWGKDNNWNGFTLKQVNYGLYFKIYGGYAEFFDTNFDAFNDEQPLEVLLCHSCSVKVMKIIDPKLTQKGGHPSINEDGTNCCDWSFVPESMKNQTNKEGKFNE